MKIYKIAISSSILDTLESAIKYVFDNVQWTILRKSKLMAIGVLQDYGVIEIAANNVKFESDSVYAKIFYEIWNGEYNGYGVGKPKNVPVYRGFIEGKRPTKWNPKEEIGTHLDIYGPIFGKIVDVMDPDRAGMNQIGEFNGIVGNPIDVADIIKSIINKWGNDDDFNVDEFLTPHIPDGVSKLTKELIDV